MRKTTQRQTALGWLTGSPLDRARCNSYSRAGDQALPPSGRTLRQAVQQNVDVTKSKPGPSFERGLGKGATLVDATYGPVAAQT